MSKLKPVTPGEILLEEFLKPMGLSTRRRKYYDVKYVHTENTESTEK